MGNFTAVTHRFVGLALAMLLCVSVAQAQSGASRVAPVLARVLSYDRTLTARAGGQIDLVIVHSSGAPASGSQGRALSAAFESLGHQTIQGLPLNVHLTDLGTAGVGSLPSGTDVIVVCDGIPGATSNALFAHARSRHLLVVTLSRAALESHGAVAVFMEDGRPRIVTKMRHVQDTGIQLASPLLRLSEVI